MFKDKSLVPAEAIRLAALGILAQGPKAYSELAAEIRHFTSRIAGPSLDLIGTPLELLRFEGLIVPAATDQETAFTSAESSLMEAGPLVLTETGHKELNRLLKAAVRAPINDVNKVVIALKLRFLHLLPPDEQGLQVDMLIDLSERELARLTDLRQHHANEPGLLLDWLDHDIAQVSARLYWFESLRDRVDG